MECVKSKLLVFFVDGGSKFKSLDKYLSRIYAHANAFTMRESIWCMFVFVYIIYINLNYVLYLTTIF
jgi:hypothetical protein